jgi:hypothetical protein
MPLTAEATQAGGHMGMGYRIERNDKDVKSYFRLNS